MDEGSACPFKALGLQKDATHAEIHLAADASGGGSEEARLRALRLYDHPPCNKARLRRQAKWMEQRPEAEENEAMRQLEEAEEHQHRRKVVEKVIRLYETELYQIGRRDRTPSRNDAEFNALKAQWDRQVRSDAEDIFWNGYGGGGGAPWSSKKKQRLQTDAERPEMVSSARIAELEATISDLQQQIERMRSQQPPY